MATASQWLEGARLRTLPAAVAPVLVGTGAAVSVRGQLWWKAALALVVALAMQVGVNYANDYSDGVRGTDAARVGPLRLVGSGAAAPGAVKRAALAAFAVGCAAGLVLAATTAWWLLAVGAVAVAAAWGYTGGPVPYGYRALGEVAVFAFFGLVAVVGTCYVQTRRVTGASVAGAVAVGLLACAILVANNLRDVGTDRVAGKVTLAVVVGERRTRALYPTLLAAPFAVAVGLAATGLPWAALALLAVPAAWRPARLVVGGATGPALIPVLRDTGLLELVYSVLLGLGLALR